MMKLTPEIAATLEKLKSERKFIEEDFYPGAPTNEIRIQCEDRVNSFFLQVESLLNNGTTDAALYTEARSLEDSFSSEDTEERGKVGDYIGEFMRAANLDDWI